MTNTAGKLHELDEHIHSQQLVAPSGAPPVTLTSGGGAWTLGNFSNDIIAAAAVALTFDIHWFEISNASANVDYEIVIYAGAGDTEMARTKFTRTAPFTSSKTLPCQTIQIAKGSRVRAKMMDSAGGATCEVSINYHTY